MIRAVVIGFGNVGRAILREFRALTPPGLQLKFVGAASSRGGTVLRSQEEYEELEKLAHRD
ncbi:MAG: hypothetical protein DRO39_09550, partial [Thermoprotei archaeon]